VSLAHGVQAIAPSPENEAAPRSRRRRRRRCHRVAAPAPRAAREKISTSSLARA
jgi:hypothetical protein